VTQQKRLDNTFIVTHQKKTVRGRPKVAKEKAKATFISTRVSAEEAKEIRAAIKASGKTKSVWVREALLGGARSMPE
jgi:hypothetical protein